MPPSSGGFSSIHWSPCCCSVESGGAGDGSGNRVLASGFSGRGHFFALCDDLKRLLVYRTESLPWTLLSSRQLVRRATSLTFTSDEATVLVADKSGDVYSFPTLTQVKEKGQAKDEEVEDKEKSEGKTEGQLLLGHLSMVLDMCLAQGDRYVVTCDRDEKVRMSHFPNGYNIHAFCLGHTQFVSCLIYVEEFQLLLSGSGDCSLRAWNMEGKQLCQAQCAEKQTTASVTAQQQILPTESPQQPPQKTENDDEEEKKKETTTSTMREEEERRAVRGLAYSKRFRLLVVSFHRQAELQVFQLKVKDGQTSLTHLQTIPVPRDPWDVTWDDSSATLWVLSPVEGAPLSAFQLRERPDGEKEASEDLHLYEVTDTGLTDSAVGDMLRTVNANCTFFTDSLHVASPIPTLWKTCRQDNVQQYQQRKQQRLQAHHHHHQHQPGRQKQRRQKHKKSKKRAKNEADNTGMTAAASEQSSEGSAEKKAREDS